MKGLMSYSGLTTKIRAMQSRLLKDENFREIVELPNVPAAVTYLKQQPSYAPILNTAGTPSCTEAISKRYSVRACITTLPSSTASRT